MLTVAIVAPGAMGAAIAAVLTGHGVRVLTSLDGRGAESRARAAAAGMEATDDAALAAADIFLSVLPPHDALALAGRFAPALAASARKPVYLDGNAVSPETVRAIAAVLGPTGCPFVDGCIIGPPPRPGSRTVLYVAGEGTERLQPLAAAGLTLRTVPGPAGAASALKMAYAGLTKGLTALGAAMALAAQEAGVADALVQELAESQPALGAWLKPQLPPMYAKAYRWSGEMREIARFLADQGGPAAIYESAATLYDTLAEDYAGPKAATGTLDGFVGKLRG